MPAILYDEIDRNKLFRGTVAAEDRSIMNVCFVMNDEYKELEDEFSKFAAGCRYGRYQGTPLCRWFPCLTVQRNA